MFKFFSKRTLSALLLVSLMTAQLASCQSGGDEPLPTEGTLSDISGVSDGGSESETTAGAEPISSDDVTSAEDIPEDTTTVTSAETAGVVMTAPGAPEGAGVVVGETTKRTSSTTARKNTGAPVQAKPTGGAGTSDPKSAVSPKITTAEGKPSLHALYQTGETITLEGYVPTDTTATTAFQQPAFETAVEVSPSTPLLDGVDCIVNEIDVDAIAAESVTVITSPDMLPAIGLDPSVYTESFFSNYCLIVADTALLGTIGSTRVLSLEEANGGLTLTVRFERKAQNGIDYKRYIIETSSKYAAYPLTVKKQYADINAKYTALAAVDTRISFSYELMYPAVGSNMKNSYAIPAVTQNTAAARALNDDIERTVYRECGDLIAGYADGLPGVTSSVTYQWGQNPSNKLIWIMLYINNNGVLAVNAAHVYGFYYDPVNGRRLSCAEYLAANGLSADKVASDLMSGYSVSISAAAVEAVRVYSASSYVFTYWDGSASHEYVLPVTVASNGIKYLHSVASDGTYNGVTAVTPQLKTFGIGGFTSVTPPQITFDASGLMMGIAYTSRSSGSFMVASLETGAPLYNCKPDNTAIAAWYGMPAGSVVVLAPKTISGTSSHFNVVIDCTVAYGTNSVSGLMFYDSLTGKLSHLTSDGLMLDGPWTANMSANTAAITNGTVTRNVPGDFTKPSTVAYSSDWHYASISTEIETFTVDEVREGQSTLTTKYGTFSTVIADLASGKVLNVPQYTIAGLLGETGIADAGYVHLSQSFGGWTSPNTFNMVMTLLSADGTGVLTLVASCAVSNGVLSVASITRG